MIFPITNQKGSTSLLTIFIGCILLFNTFFLSKSVYFYQKQAYYNLMKLKLNYAAISGLSFISMYEKTIPVFNVTINKYPDDIYKFHKDSLKINLLDNIDVGLVKINNSNYSIAVSQEFRCLYEF